MQIKKIIFPVLIFLFVFFVGCKKNENLKEEFTKEHEYYLSDEIINDKGWEWFDKTVYEETLNDHVFLKVSYSEIEKAMNSSDRTVIYFGFNPSFYQCPYCVACLPIANDAAKEAGVKEILYLDIYQMRTDNTIEYQTIYNKIIEEFPDFGSRISVPTYVVVEEGKVVSYHIATLSYVDEAGATRYYQALTVEQKEELKNIYINMFKKN